MSWRLYSMCAISLLQCRRAGRLPARRARRVVSIYAKRPDMD